MKPSIWRRWCKSLFSAKRPPPASRARPRRQSLALQVLEDRVTPSLTPQMVLDINTNTWSSNPSQMVAIGSTAYFVADDGIHGLELWKSDGTVAGTTLVKEIYPGNFNGDYGGNYAGNYRPSNLTNVNGTLFFSANDGTYGKVLWKSDGTADGTVLVSSLARSPSYLTDVNGTLFFSAYSDATGSELWKSDGTAAGTVLVKDINPGWQSSNPRHLTNVNGTLFFTTWDYYGTITPGLWKSDGTAAGTVLVKNLYEEYPGQDGLQPRDFTSANGTLFFRGYDPATGWELWKSNGTAAGTGVVKDIYPGTGHGYPRNLTNVNGTLFFTADDGTNGTELWKSNGTAAGTVMVKDISPGSANPSHLADVNGTLFFTASDVTNGLWKSDGTAAGTVLVKRIDTETWSSILWLTNVNGTLFFTVSGSTHGSELWKSDGTATGTVLVKNTFPGSAWISPTSLTNVNGTLVFAADDGRNGVELWKSDGTAAGTTLVKDIRTDTLSSYPGNMADVNGTLFFAANDGVHGTELWKSDGTIAGTTLVKDIFPGGNTGYYGGYYPRSSSPSNLTNVNGTVFFTVWNAGTGTQLWKSDGTEAGTVLVASVTASGLTDVNGTLFFTAGDGRWGIDGVELWKSDGTTAGTVMVKDIYPGSHREYGYFGYYYVPNSSYPGELTNVNGMLFFSATDETHGRELWRSDGTAAGTTLVKDINPGNSNSFANSLTNLNGTLFFSARDGTTGWELWKSDGTAAGTVLVKDIRPAGTGWYTGSYPHSLANVDGTLFFAANDGATGYELWKSDGTAAGTVLVKDIKPGSGNSYPGDELYLPGAMAVVNGTLFFTANDGTHGRELWKSDGSEDGTIMVKDIYPGIGTVYTGPFHLTSVNDDLFFVASNAIWQSDGTEAGTVLLANIYSNLGNSLVNFNGTLFLSASDGVHGTELWKLADDGQGQGSLGVSGFPATVTAGAAGSFTVTMKNADGTTNTSYRGTVHFTSSDPQAVLPADYTFTEADQGTHTFTATLKTAGSQSITASDTLTPGVTGTQSGITVNPAAASSFTVAGFPSPVTAGAAGSFTVTALDAYGNRATGYTGTVRFTSSDAQAVLPGDYTFTAADTGRHTFSAALKTAGTQSLTVTDTASAAIAGSQGGILVNPAAASRLLTSAPASVNAGAKFSLTVTVVDTYGNVVTGYRGTIGFRSSERTAKLPRNYTFTATDQGVHTFTGLVLKKKGRQTITVSDTLDKFLTASVSIEVR